MIFEGGTEASVDDSFPFGWEQRHGGNCDAILSEVAALECEAKVLAIKSISDRSIHDRIACGVFGPKNAGDMGLVTTVDRPGRNSGDWFPCRAEDFEDK